MLSRNQRVLVTGDAADNIEKQLVAGLSLGRANNVNSEFPGGTSGLTDSQ